MNTCGYNSSLIVDEIQPIAFSSVFAERMLSCYFALLRSEVFLFIVISAEYENLFIFFHSREDVDYSRMKYDTISSGM